MIYWLLILILPFNFYVNGEEIEDNTDSTMSYLEKRKEWLLQDSKESFSSGLILNEAEQKLDNYLQTFCYHFWNHFLESNLFPPSKNFSEAKAAIESTMLFRILQRMPKGGILHIHSDSTGNPTWLVKRAIEDENGYIYMQEDDTLLKGTMRCFTKGKAPYGFQSMRVLAAKDINFVPKIVEMITMNSADTLSVNPWIKFNECFSRTENLFLYEPIFTDFYQNAFEAIAEDNLQFIELRTALDPIFDINGKMISNNEIIALFRQIVQKVREKYPHFILKLIVSDFRSKNLGEAYRSLERAFKLRSDNPDLVVGYDLVGFETTGHSLLYYLDNLLLAAADFEKKYQITLPYFFHAGESGWGHDKNPYDAVLLGSKRIGHGFNLVYFPKLLQEIKKQNICIEVCPISNQVLGYVKDLRIHPAVGYLKQGVPCVLSSDDPLIFRTKGLSYDFWEAIMAWNLGLVDIKQLCMNSIIFSSLSDQEKAEALAQWEGDWDLFVRHTLADLQIAN